MRSQATGGAASRVGALRLALLLLIAGLAVRAGQLATQNPDAVDQGLRQVHTRITLPGARGLILDRAERELAISVDAPSVYVFPKLLGDRDAAARALAGALGLDPGPLAERIAAHDGFTYVARWIEPERAERVRALALPGVGLQDEPRRTYPARAMAAPLIGFADIDGRGVRGLEQLMDEWLQGRSHTLAVERDATGRLLSSETIDWRRTAGGDIKLTLDAGLQAQAEAALAEAIVANQAIGGLVICVEPSTGDVLSLAESPSFDPNDFRHTPYADTRSRAFVDALEPGSTMKAFLVASALEAGVIDAGTRFDTGDGLVRVKGKTIRDHHPYGVIDPRGLLQFSSNVGAVQVAERLGAERQHAALLRFGFGRTTASGFPQESAGLLRSWREWKPVDQATVAFGQGMNVTPIQLAMATAALAHDGVLMRPRLVAARRTASGEWESLPPVVAGRVASAETSREVLAMMESVIGPEGTGRLAGLAGVRVAGKTGTAQRVDPDTGAYSDRRFTSWFVGVAPADDPRVAIVVALDEPRRPNHTGGMSAAPLFARVAASQLERHGIVTQPEPVPPIEVPIWVAVQERIDARKRAELAQSGEARPRIVTALTPDAAPPRASAPSPAKSAAVSAGPRPGPAPLAQRASAAPAAPRADAVPAARRASAVPVVQVAVRAAAAEPATVLVPDFRGSSLDHARRLAAREALDVRIHGSGQGRVVGQSPSAGTILFGSDRTVILSFSSREEG